jgi:hypothetical protein
MIPKLNVGTGTINVEDPDPVGSGLFCQPVPEYSPPDYPDSTFAITNLNPYSTILILKKRLQKKTSISPYSGGIGVGKCSFFFKNAGVTPVSTGIL